MSGLNLSGFTKIREDGHTATMIHKDGHQITVAKAMLKPIQLKQLEKLPVHLADGGVPDGTPSPMPTPAPEQTGSTEIDNTPAPEGDPAPTNTAQVTGDRSADASAAPTDADAAPAPSGQPAAAPAQDPLQAQPNKANGLQMQMSANNQLAKAEGNEGKQEADAIDDTQKQLAQLPTQQQVMDKYAAKNQQFQDYIAQHDVNPNSFWQHKDTNQKIAAGIGLFLGGFSTPFTHQGNPALQIINNAIERDIDAQKANINKNQTLWSMNREAMKDDLAANLATRSQALIGLQNQIAKVSALNKSPIALARAAQLNAVVKQELDQLAFKQSLISGPTADNADPSTRVQFLVPPAQQEKVFGQIDAAKSVVQNGPSILKAFDDAASKLHAADFVPGRDNVDQKALHALMGPTFKDIEGSVRPAAMENIFNNTTPQFGDTKAQLETKRNALVGYLTSKNADNSAAKGFGIDLSKYPATNVNLVVQKSQPTDGKPQVVMQNGHEYRLNPKTGKYE